MGRPTVLALVLAGGEGSRMEILTERRAKPALPFAGVYRLIDLPLSNLRNSAIDDVWVAAQYEVQSVVDVVAGGRPWDLDRTHGGLRFLTPEQRRDLDDEQGWHEGNADAIFQSRELIRQFAPDVLLVLSADHVYRLNFADVVTAHLDRDADLTIVSTRVPIEQARHHGVIEVDADGRVTGFAHKPEEPPSDVVTTEVFAYRTSAILDTLEALAGKLGDGTQTNLGDFGEHLVPALVERGSVFDFRLEGYWKDLGRPETYFEAHMDLLDGLPGLELDDPLWPVFTRDHQRLPARIRSGALVEDSLVSPGCVVAGTVRHSVLGPGVTVAADAVVENAVVLTDVEIREEAEVRYAIVDQDAVIGKGALVGETPPGKVTTDNLVLVGMGAHVRGRRKLRAGERVEPDTARRLPHPPTAR